MWGSGGGVLTGRRAFDFVEDSLPITHFECSFLRLVLLKTTFFNARYQELRPVYANEEILTVCYSCHPLFKHLKAINIKSDGLLRKLPLNIIKYFNKFLVNMP